MRPYSQSHTAPLMRSHISFSQQQAISKTQMLPCELLFLFAGKSQYARLRNSSSELSLMCAMDWPGTNGRTASYSASKSPQQLSFPAILIDIFKPTENRKEERRVKIGGRASRVKYLLINFS